MWGDCEGSQLRRAGVGTVGKGFNPDAKRGTVEIVCKMRGGGRGLRHAWSYPLVVLFLFPFLFL